MRARGFWPIAVMSCAVTLAADSARAQEVPLKSVDRFSALTDERARSVALFAEAARVITSPRCMNCHPATRQPTQGDDLHPHIPPMYAGTSNQGTPGLACKSCHGATNVATPGSRIASLPGNRRWSLAPASMAWQGKTPAEICVQIKDEKRNGGRTLTDIHRHLATDSLVGWAWNPGAGRVPAPGTQAAFGALIEAWISSGAHCPNS
jgi:hypothetical protein